MWVVDVLLDIIFPPSHREKAVAKFKIEDFLVAPHTFRLNDTAITSLLSYKDKKVAYLIRVLKYNGSPVAASLCAQILEDFLREEVAEIEMFSDKRIIITSVPLGKQRKHERGFNQTALILKKLKDMFPTTEIRDDILVRIKETKPQTTLSRTERLKNVENAFALTEYGKTITENTLIILIDDVTTTGATLHAASRPLKKPGIQTLPLAIAHG